MTHPQGPWPFPTSEHHPPAADIEAPKPIEPSEEAIDHAVEESFPASDPVAVNVTVVPRAEPLDEEPPAAPI